MRPIRLYGGASALDIHRAVDDAIATSTHRNQTVEIRCERCAVDELVVALAPEDYTHDADRGIDAWGADDDGHPWRVTIIVCDDDAIVAKGGA